MGQIPTCAPHSADTVSSEDFPSPLQQYAHKNKVAVRISAMCLAAANGDLESMQKLMAAGLTVDATDYDGRTALHIAVANGQLEVVQFLLSARADVQAVDRWGHTVMDEATNGNFHDLQSVLRLAGAEHGATPRGASPLERAVSPLESPDSVEDGVRLCSIAAKGDIEAMRQHQHAGVCINVTDYDGRSALHVAAAQGHLELVQWLLQAKADVNRRDNFKLTPLTEAQRNGHGSTAKMLMSNGALAADLELLRLSSDCEHWAVPVQEVKLGPILSKTLKSRIYLATWRGTKVVAKTSGCFVTTPSSGSGDEQSLAVHEMLHEINVLSTLRHPDLVMFLGACLNHDPPFFITEFMEGGDLERYFRAKSQQLSRPFRPSGVLFMKWANSIARALSFLHNCTQPIIHRDLKPLNLLLTKSQELKVTDFGISKLMRPRAPGQSSAMEPDCSMSGGIGTWRYMAPEVVRYEQYTDRVDIYSFALILWFMYTGLQPFVEQFGHDAEVVLKEYLKGKEPRPDCTYAGTRCGPSIGADLHKFINDCWHAVPAQRPSAFECTERLSAMPTSQSSLGEKLGNLLR